MKIKIPDFKIGIVLRGIEHHPLYGIDGIDESRMSLSGGVALPDPDPEMMDDPLYANAWFYRDLDFCHTFDGKRLKEVPKIVTSIDSLGIEGIESVVIRFIHKENDDD